MEVALWQQNLWWLSLFVKFLSENDFDHVSFERPNQVAKLNSVSVYIFILDGIHFGFTLS